MGHAIHDTLSASFLRLNNFYVAEDDKKIALCHNAIRYFPKERFELNWMPAKRKKQNWVQMI